MRKFISLCTLAAALAAPSCASEFEVVDVLRVDGAALFHSSATLVAPDSVKDLLWVSTSAVTPHLYVSSSGAVGLGTADPAVRLHVAGTAGEAGTIIAVSTGSTNLFWVAGDGAHAVKFFGDGSGLTNLAGAADNLGNHTATQTLDLAGFPVLSVSSLTMSGAGLLISSSIYTGASGVFISTAGSIMTQGLGNGSALPAARGLGAVDLQTARSATAHIAAGLYSVVSGGSGNRASNTSAVVSGGDNCTASGYASVVGGGQSNSASGSVAVVSGGLNNAASGNSAVAGGGRYNAVSGDYAAIPGGYGNLASGAYSFAAGFASSSTAAGAFTWADAQGVGVDNKSANRTLFKSRGGFMVTGSTNTAMAGTLDRGVLLTGDGLVGISTGVPYAALDVVSTGTASNVYAQIWRNSIGIVVASMTSTGSLMASRFVGDGSGLTNLAGAGGGGDSLGTHVATQTLNMAAFNIVAVSSVNFLPNVFLASAAAADYGGVYVSSNIYVAGRLYGDGSGLTGIGGTLSGGQTPLLPYWTSANALGNSSLSQDSGGLTVMGSSFSVQGAFGVGGGALAVNNARVGIGTVSPAYPLDLLNAGVPQARVGYSVNEYTTLQTDSGGHTRIIGNNNGNTNEVHLFNSGGAGYIRFLSNGGYERLRITDSGDVGISTNAPVYRLHVSSGAGETGTVMAVSTGTSNLFWVAGDGAHAVKFFGDGSGLTNLAGAADNLGNHTATEVLKMGAYGVNTSSAITAARYQINGSTVLAILPGAGSLGVGVNAGRASYGNYNVFVGSGAGYANTSGEGNSFFGWTAGKNTVDGVYNSYFGYMAGEGGASGYRNSYFGYRTGINNNGNNNSFFGTESGFLNAAGEGNLFLGYQAGFYEMGSNKLYIANSGTVSPLIFGDFSARRVGISTGNPQAALDIVSTGTGPDIYAQLWRDGSGVVVGSMSSTGSLMAVRFIGDGSGITGLPGGDNLGNHTATQALNMAAKAVINVSSLTVNAPTSISDALWVSTSSVSPHLYVSTGGRVGIGTAAPASALHIVSGSVQLDDGDGDGIKFAGGARVGMDNNGQNLTLQTGLTNLRIADNPFTGTIMYVTNSGKVGIGVPDPTDQFAKFEVMGSVAQQYSVKVGTSSTAYHLVVSTAGKVGIGTASPGARLEVAGQVKITGGAPGAGKVLTSDAEGLATWGTASGDNLGNHTATQTLNLAAFPVINVSSIAMLGDGLRISTSIYPGANGIFISAAGAVMTLGAGAGTILPNARGAGAVDLQTYRDDAAQVASGSNSGVLGGVSNTAAGDYSAVAGGGSNSAAGMYAAVGGGDSNAANGDHSTVSGGTFNTAGGAKATVAGGDNNTAGGGFSVVSGGSSNTAAYAATVPGGFSNTAGGNFSFAAGFASSATASGTFVWSDSQGQVTRNDVADRTLFKNAGGFMVTGSTNTTMAGTLNRGVLITGNALVGISTGVPYAALDVVSTGTAVSQMAQLWRDGGGTIVSSMSATGTLMAARFVGDGAALTNISANAGVYTLAQMETLAPAAAGRLISVSNASAPYSYCVSTGTAAGAWVLLNQTLHCR